MSKQIAYFDTVTHGYSGKTTTANSVLTTDEDGALVDSFATDGDGIQPASTTTQGWTITSNYQGFNEVNLWSTVNADGLADQGFYFHQKLTNSTDKVLAAIYGDDTFSELAVTRDDGTNGFVVGASATEAYFIAAAPSVPTALPYNLYVNGAVRINAPVDSAGGGVALTGVTTNNDAAALRVGEYIKSNIAVASAVALTTATAKTVTSISLTAGDWEVTGTVAFNPAAGTLIVDMRGGISQTNNTLPTLSDSAALVDIPLSPSAGVGATIPVGTSRVSLAGTTTIYLVAQCTFTISTNAAYGFISARRMR